MDVREFRSDDDDGVIMSLHVSLSGDGIKVPVPSGSPCPRKNTCLPDADNG